MSNLKPMMALLIVLALSFSTMDRMYVQDIRPDGSSTIQKTMDLSIFANKLSASSFQAMADFCARSSQVSCSVDAASKTVTIKESLASGSYYSVNSEYGFPFITQTLTIDRIPNDMFGASLNTILAAANITAPDQSAVQALNLHDDNNASASVLKAIGANYTYIVTMPSSVSEARSGGYNAAIDGDSATFDLVQVLSQSQPMVLVSGQINSFVVVIIIGIIVLGALAYSFFGSKPSKTRKKKAGKK
jgi:hypothetical protein